MRSTGRVDPFFFSLSSSPVSLFPPAIDFPTSIRPFREGWRPTHVWLFSARLGHRHPIPCLRNPGRTWPESRTNTRLVDHLRKRAAIHRRATHVFRQSSKRCRSYTAGNPRQWPIPVTAPLAFSLRLPFCVLTLLVSPPFTHFLPTPSPPSYTLSSASLAAPSDSPSFLGFFPIVLSAAAVSSWYFFSPHSE